MRPMKILLTRFLGVWMFAIGRDAPEEKQFNAGL